MARRAKWYPFEAVLNRLGAAFGPGGKMAPFRGLCGFRGVVRTPFPRPPAQSGSLAPVSPFAPGADWAA
eukprot:646334-Heterocapsa_arctica.AAC.1